MTPPSRVIVIGAGAAGLGAARTLADAGADVTVIEARSHIAGRAHTSLLWPDLPVDMGASWIHGVRSNPLTALADALDLPRIRTPYRQTVAFDEGGKPLDFRAAADAAKDLLEAGRAALACGGPDVSVQTAIEASPQWAALGPAARRLIRLALHTRYEHDYSGDWSRLSARWFDDGCDMGGGDVVMSRGFGPIMAHLAQAIDIRLGTPVAALAPTATGVTVQTPGGTLHADAAIVTLPLGLLKAGVVRLATPLAPARQDAIDRLETGLLNKCWLRFDTVFWPPRAAWLDYLGPADRPMDWAEWTSFLPATGQPLLVGFNAAAPAEALERLTDAETVSGAMAALRAMFGCAVPDPVGHQISRWRSDPYARGAYSFQPVGTDRTVRTALFGTDWDGRLIFAGEAASDRHPGTVHGALMTGRAAAGLALRG